MKKRLSIGIVGAGQFSGQFGNMFSSHPLVEGIAVADRVPERAEEFARNAACTQGVYDSFDALCGSGVDAVAIFTPRHTHAALALQALEAGKHVYCAVPAAFTLEEAAALVETVERTGRVFMTGETSYYYPSTLYCRKAYREGVFGDFVYGEAQYTHDMETWGPHFELSYGDDWRSQAGMPPFYYPSHSVSMLLSVIGDHVTKVSAFGFEDHQADRVYGAGRNAYDNPFSNEFGLMRTASGGTLRITEGRRLGLFNDGREVCLNMFYGTDACYEEHSMGACLATRKDRNVVDLAAQLACPYFPDKVENYSLGVDSKVVIDGYRGVSPVHPIDRLPESFRGLGTGHNGSHQFLVDDFVKACVHDAVPPNSVWDSVHYCVPGIVGHASALEGGRLMDVPCFGAPPPEKPRLEEMHHKVIDRNGFLL